jgi:RHS repeat-associated protein
MNKKIQKIMFLCAAIMWHAFMLQANNENPVGAIPGAIDVSPMGAATYTIPIEVVPGTQGMQPNLSIVYNSFSGMGVLGMKWHLVGISAITRCGQTVYYDNGNITAIGFGTSDRYSLDGDRLIVLGNNTYATQMETFTRIVRYTGSNRQKGTYEYFVAYTDDGRIMEYGNTEDSRQTMGGTSKVLSWQINRITDANGNYMTFHYQNSGNEIWIYEIRYTGNTNNGMVPYARVTFNYTGKPDMLGKNTHFVGGYAVPQTRLLQNIMVSMMGSFTVVRNYQFNYNTQGERTTHLTEIVLSDRNEIQNPTNPGLKEPVDGGTNGSNTQLNATTITWREQNYTQPTEQLPADFTGGHILAGDFNGDGYTDIVLYGTGAQKNKYELWTGNASGTFVKTTTGGTHKAIGNGKGCYFYKADVNGCGADELIILELADETLNHYQVRILGLSQSGNTFQGTTIHNFHQLFLGDFDGDGKTDILFLKKNPQDPYHKCSFAMYRSNTYYTLTLNESNGNAECAVRVGDFNNNGKTDVELTVHTGNNNAEIQTYFYSGQFHKLFEPQPATFSYKRYTGDFNGDGITDLLVYENASNGWKIYFGNGDGSYIPASTPAFNGPNGLSNYGSIVIADFDGDGKDDILQYASGGAQILYSKGCVNGQYRYAQQAISTYWAYSDLAIADMNNDGFLDIVTRSNGQIHTIFYVNKDKQYDFPKEITDGLGKTIKLNFTPRCLPSSDFNMSRNVSKKYFHQLLNHLQVSNGLGAELHSLHYLYFDPVFSLLRKSFLGFRKFERYDIQEDKDDFYEFKVDDEGTTNSKHVLIPRWHDVFYNRTGYTVGNYGMFLKGLPSNRYIMCESPVTEFKLTKTRIKTYHVFDTEDGRLIRYWAEYEDISGRDLLRELIFTDKKEYSYHTIAFNDRHKKTVPERIVATQKYGYSTIIPADTLTYDYDPATGNLNWERRSNIHGAITTTYVYEPTGVYGKKTVSAQNCDTLIETYEYDNTHRFIKTVTNPEGHIMRFTHDTKTGNVLSQTDANGLTTAYNYDVFGNLTKILYPDSTQTEITTHWYTSAQIPNARYYTKTVSTGKPALEVYYDVLGREVCRKEDERSAATYILTQYNDKGQVEKTSCPFKDFDDPDILWNYFTYDDFGRQDSVITPYAKLSYEYALGKVTVTDHLREVSSYKDYDAAGKIIEAKDAGGTITYSYAFADNHTHETTINHNNVTTKMVSDLWGNRLSITEPNAGTITSTYNGFNELIQQKDARGNITTWQYDQLGRVTQKNFTGSNSIPQSITYTYDHFTDASKGNGKLHRILVNNEISEVFTYDTLSRLSGHDKIIDRIAYKHSYTYTPNGQLHQLTYPTGFGIAHTYGSNGELIKIQRSDNNSLIYSVGLRNLYRSPLSCEYGNDAITDYTYNPVGMLTNISTGSKRLSLPIKGVYGFISDSTLLNYRYTYDRKGLMVSRSESVIKRLEEFTYDKLDRLTKITAGSIGQTGTAQTFTYSGNGNITNNSQVGSYTYHGGKPHAVIYVFPVNDYVISPTQCDVVYNFFNQPTQIIDSITLDRHQVDLSYGTDQQRHKALKRKNGALESSRRYISKHYEIEADYSTRTIRHHHYIYGENGIAALHVITTPFDTAVIKDPDAPIKYHSASDTIESTYYIHTDQLGSYCVITDGKRNVVQRNFFDPWGNVALPDSTLNFTVTDRGFTGHEHYPNFKIINMNGRLYDPVIGRFFSPDNYVQLPEFTQAFNRYSYALSNPLKYIDPDGQRFVDVDDTWEINNEGRIVNRIEDKTQDAFYMVAKDTDGNYQRTYTTDAEGNKIYNSIIFPYGTIESQRSISFSPDGKTRDSYDVYKVRGDNNGIQLYDFMSNNITGSPSAAEISQAMTGIAGEKGLNFITTSHQRGKESGMTYLLNGQLLRGYTIRELNHSHPYSPTPSISDMGFASEVSRIMRERNTNIPAFHINYVPWKQKIPFGK